MSVLRACSLSASRYPEIEQKLFTVRPGHENGVTNCELDPNVCLLARAGILSLTARVPDVLSCPAGGMSLQGRNACHVD